MKIFNELGIRYLDFVEFLQLKQRTFNASKTAANRCITTTYFNNLIQLFLYYVKIRKRALKLFRRDTEPASL